MEDRTTAPASAHASAPAPRQPVRPLRDFAGAVGLLTVVPVGGSWPDGRPPRAVGWYGAVGWLLAACAFVPLWFYARASAAAPVPTVRALLFAVLVVGGWALLTRFLHWDGLADTVDGIGGGSTPERRLEIMRDSHIGAFGAVAIGLVALVQVASVALLISRGVLWPLLVAPVVARFSVSLASWELPAARPDGLGRAVIGTAGLYEKIVAAVALLALLACLFLGATQRQFVFVSGAGIVAGIAVPRLLSKQVGGMTGDLFGATVLLVETAVLLMGAVI
jgi:adenosylcobinamide-GDP ribazoletransferase